jgi:acetylornithine/succinyldiaminopimelate/putrescine aminotransferase
MIFLSLAEHVPLEASEVAARLAQSGVLVGAIDTRRFRLVTHYWVDDRGVDRAVAAFEQVMQETMI